MTKRTRDLEVIVNEQDVAILRAVQELHPHHASPSQSRRGWQLVAEKVIEETGDDEISGGFCKRRYTALVRESYDQSIRGSSASDELQEIQDAGQDEEENVTKWQNTAGNSLVSPTCRFGVAKSSSHSKSPGKSPPVMATASARRRELLDRVAAVRDREKKKKTMKPRTTTVSDSVVLSSLLAESSEDPPMAAASVSPSPASTTVPAVDPLLPSPRMDKAPPRNDTREEDCQATTAIMTESPVAACRPPQRRARSFLASVLDRVTAFDTAWFKSTGSVNVKQEEAVEEELTPCGQRETAVQPSLEEGSDEMEEAKEMETRATATTPTPTTTTDRDVKQETRVHRGEIVDAHEQLQQLQQLQQTVASMASALATLQHDVEQLKRDVARSTVNPKDTQTTRRVCRKNQQLHESENGDTVSGE